MSLYTMEAILEVDTKTASLSVGLDAMIEKAGEHDENF